jgi:hypothetical protein
VAQETVNQPADLEHRNWRLVRFSTLILTHPATFEVEFGGWLWEHCLHEAWTHGDGSRIPSRCLSVDISANDYGLRCAERAALEAVAFTVHCAGMLVLEGISRR